MSTTTAPATPTSTDGVRGALATRAQAVTAPERGEGGRLTIAGMIDLQRDEIARALPRHMDADRLARIATTVIKGTPKLLECTSSSLLGALMISAQTGLEPGPLGHAYLVPRWNSSTKANECQWMLGYKGIVELFRRSGHMLSIEAREVCEHDDFDYEYGLNERLVHKPNMTGDRGAITAVWGLAKFKDGGHYFVVLSRADIDAAKARSETGKKGTGPWASDYAAMARKTVIRRMAPYLPLSPEEATVLTHDETVPVSFRPNMTAEPAEAAWVDADVIEPGELPPPGVTPDGEITDAPAGEGEATGEEPDDPDGVH